VAKKGPPASTTSECVGEDKERSKIIGEIFDALVGPGSHIVVGTAQPFLEFMLEGREFVPQIWEATF